MTKKEWMLKKPPTAEEESLSVYPPLTRRLLFNRNIKTAKEADEFLKPDYGRDIHDPFLIAGMERAVERVLAAIEKREHVIVFADYDCDGIPGAVVLHDFFRKIGYENFSVYIPHRYREGYSLNIPAIEQFAREGAALIITVDCGITDFEQVAHAEDLGMDVIITDHHLPHEEENGTQKLPQAFVILNSKQTHCGYPFEMLSGAGVVWKLVQALLERGRFGVLKGWEKWLLDMVGMAAFADMVPLTGENRAIAHFGLQVLRKSPRSGLQALLRLAKVEQGLITEEDVGYVIGPRINAASRLSEPRLAFELLATRDDADGGALAKELETLNRRRKEVVREIMREAHTHAHASAAPVLVVGREAWHPGVLGLAANMLAETHNKTSFVWGMEGCAHAKGSCRSAGEVNVVALMSAAHELARIADEDLFLDFGGHQEAGGFSLALEKTTLLPRFLESAWEKLAASYGEEMKAGKQKITDTVACDAELAIDDVNMQTWNEIAQFAPFGIGNEKPIFLFRDIAPARIELFGAEKQHLRLVFLQNNGEEINAISFSGVPKFAHLNLIVGKPVDLVASLELSHFRGRPELRLRINEICA